MIFLGLGLVWETHRAQDRQSVPGLEPPVEEVLERANFQVLLVELVQVRIEVAGIGAPLALHFVLRGVLLL